MSYNLMAEGDVDLFELSQLAQRYEPLELFPIPADDLALPGPDRPNLFAPDALGIAVASSRSGPPALAALRELVELLWSKQARVYDLYSGDMIATADDLTQLLSRVGG